MMMSNGILFVLGILLSASALGWNAGGHRLVAAIAWAELAAAEREAVAQLLDAHPDVSRWQRRVANGDDPDFVRFAEAATWADDIRHDRRFYDEGMEPATPTLAGFPDMARRRSWHYLNLPLTGTAAAGTGGELDVSIGREAAVLSDRSLPASRRAYALVWLIHLVGDIHQPLHVGTRRQPDGGDDAGGNGLPVFDPTSSRRPETNLHAWWDDLPAPPWLRGSRLRSTATALRARLPATLPAADVAVWRAESHRLARDFAYGGDSVPFVIDDAYRQRAAGIAGERIALAGVRLGRLLGTLLRGGR